jgi:hypothetical protein
MEHLVMDTLKQTTIPAGLMFKFPKINYTLQSRGDGRDSSGLHLDMQAIMITSVLSVAWLGLIIAYGAGLIANLGTTDIPFFVYASLAMITIFPIALIWAGFFVYNYAQQSHKASSAILDAARILGTPALIAAEDVKTLSSAVGHELNILRSAMRDIEDNMNGISKRIESEINTLNESSDKLHTTLSDVSGTIRAERDAIVDLMKIIKVENQNAREYLAEQDKIHIEVSDIDMITQSETPDKPIEIGELSGGEITYVNDLRMPVYPHKNQEIQTPTPQTEYHAQKNPDETRKPLQFTSDITNKNETQTYTAKPEAIILRRERQLYEGVCALTVDLNRELGIPLPQDLWSRYMRGERHVFADYLLSKLNQNFAAYQNILESDGLQKLSNQFITRFDTLRERLFDEPDVAVSEYLENSGVGKIYSLLSVEYV